MILDKPRLDRLSTTGGNFLRQAPLASTGSAVMFAVIIASLEAESPSIGIPQHVKKRVRNYQPVSMVKCR
jgi:hypothetical protein